MLENTATGDEVQPSHASTDAATLLVRTQALADELAARSNLGLTAAPRRELARCAELGLLTAPLPLDLGGLGLGIVPGTHLTLLRLLAILGSADLALGRLYEGHVNGLLLVARYGSRDQLARLAQDCHRGMLSGVWNTGSPELLRLQPDGGRFRLAGGKTFATGAAFVQRPIVTAELAAGGWQMILPHLDAVHRDLDRSFWHPLGMESSESFAIDFTGVAIEPDQLIGAPGDFYRDPIFRGGAIRFAAVQAGAVLRLHALFAEWLSERRRDDDPYQIARLGEIALDAQDCVLWIEHAAAEAERSFYREDPAHMACMVECANMSRIAIERRGTHTMRLIATGVGAQGLLQPHRFERILRDLTMYLRQPAPDQALAAVGRASVDRLAEHAGSTPRFWSDDPAVPSLTPTYFDRIYAADSDPWGFATSPYEREKYDTTLRCLPDARYARGLEVGCSIGVLTARLAERCAALLAIDVAEEALAQARRRNTAQLQVEFARMQVPVEMPEGEFDLIVVSEVGYYWQRADLERAATGLAQRHRPGGTLVLVHWTEPVPDYPLTGDQVHEYWLGRREWEPMHGERHEKYRIDILRRR